MKIIILLCIGFLVWSCMNDGYKISRGEELVNETIGRTAKLIRDKYGLKPCGSGAAMPGGPIQKLNLCFDTKSVKTREELRVLLIQTAHEMVKLVVENEEMQQYLKDPPFTIRNVQIIIYNEDGSGEDLLDPEISSAQIVNGNLDYATIDPEDTYTYKNWYKETYEEALKLAPNALLDFEK